MLNKYIIFKTARYTENKTNNPSIYKTFTINFTPINQGISYDSNLCIILIPTQRFNKVSKYELDKKLLQK